MNIVSKKIAGYIGQVTVFETNPVLAEMEILAKKMNFPIVGPEVGKLLYFFAKIKNAKSIFEMGSGFGYSAAWFAKASKDIKVICTDLAEKNKILAEKFFKKDGIPAGKFIYKIGNAVEILKNEKSKFDIIFIDIDKEYYPSALTEASGKVKKGGLIITDNVLWGGEVLKINPPKPSTRGIKEFTRLLFQDKTLETIIIPMRDGVSLSVKR